MSYHAELTSTHLHGCALDTTQRPTFVIQSILGSMRILPPFCRQVLLTRFDSERQPWASAVTPELSRVQTPPPCRVLQRTASRRPRPVSPSSSSRDCSACGLPHLGTRVRLPPELCDDPVASRPHDQLLATTAPLTNEMTGDQGSTLPKAEAPGHRSRSPEDQTYGTRPHDRTEIRPVRSKNVRLTRSNHERHRVTQHRF